MKSYDYDFQQQNYYSIYGDKIPNLQRGVTTILQCEKPALTGAGRYISELIIKFITQRAEISHIATTILPSDIRDLCSRVYKAN